MTGADDRDGGARGGDDPRLAAAAAFIAALPHSRHLGMVLETAGQAEARMSMPWAEALVGDPATGVIHGGAVSALMDTCGGAAVMLHPAEPRATATLSLRIDYMRSAVPKQRLRAMATCHHMTRSVGFVRAVAYDDDDSRPVATATGTFAVEFHDEGAP